MSRIASATATTIRMGSSRQTEPGGDGFGLRLGATGSSTGSTPAVLASIDDRLRELSEQLLSADQACDWGMASRFSLMRAFLPRRSRR